MAVLLPDVALTFDDVLLKPQYSDVLSRDNVDLSGKLGALPIVAAPMDMVVGPDMVRTLTGLGAVAVVHRFQSPSEQIATIEKAQVPVGKVMLAVGANDAAIRVPALADAGATRFCVDVAHGHHTTVLRAIEAIHDAVPDAFVMAGNVATGKGALDLARAGANCVRVGVGGGAACSTRIVTGAGYPQLSAILEVAEALEGVFHDVAIVADGGIRNSGDAAKALAAGSDAVMLGNLLAATSDSPAPLSVFRNGRHELVDDTARDELLAAGEPLFKVYRGMASYDAQLELGVKADPTKIIAEGATGHIPYAGDTTAFVRQFLGGVRSAMSYCGAHGIEEMHRKAVFVQVTPSVVLENIPHAFR